MFTTNNEQCGAKANIYNQTLQGELCIFNFGRKVEREESVQQDNANTLLYDGPSLRGTTAAEVEGTIGAKESRHPAHPISQKR